MSLDKDNNGFSSQIKVSTSFWSFTVGAAMFNSNIFTSMTDSRGSLRDENGIIIDWDDKHQKQVTFHNFYFLIAGLAESGLIVLSRVENDIRERNIRSVWEVAERVQYHLGFLQYEYEMPAIINEFILGSVWLNESGTEFKEPFLLTVRINLEITQGHVSCIGSGGEVAMSVLRGFEDWDDIMDEELIATRFVVACGEAIAQVDDCGGPLEYFSGFINNEQRRIDLDHRLFLAEPYLIDKGFHLNSVSESGELSQHAYSDPWDVLISTRHLIRNNTILKDQPFNRLAGLFTNLLIG